MQREWFALYTYPRHEKTVLAHLKCYAIDCFLPLYTAIHRWRNGVKATVHLPLFPGYVFVHTEAAECLHLVQLPSVASVVSSRGVPLSMPSREIDLLRAHVDRLSVEPYPFFHFGDPVRVTRGPLAGLEGTMVHKKGTYRFLLRIPQLMQAAAVEVDACDVELIIPGCDKRSMSSANTAGH